MGVCRCGCVCVCECVCVCVCVCGCSCVCVCVVWYGMVWGTLSRDAPSRYYITTLKSTHHAISIAVLVHYHRLLWRRLVGLITRSRTEELQTHGLYKTIMRRLTALVLMFRLTMDVIQSKIGCWMLFFLLFISVTNPLFSRIFIEK